VNGGPSFGASERLRRVREFERVCGVSARDNGPRGAALPAARPDLVALAACGTAEQAERAVRP